MNKRLCQPGLERLWLMQLGIVFLVSAFCALTMNINASGSAILGGIVAIVPNVYFASKVFKYHGARAAKKIVNSFYKGEALKIIFSIFLFIVVFRLCKITALAFFGTYIVVIMTHWFAPCFIEKQTKQG